MISQAVFICRDKCVEENDEVEKERRNSTCIESRMEDRRLYTRTTDTTIFRLWIIERQIGYILCQITSDSLVIYFLLSINSFPTYFFFLFPSILYGKRTACP